MATIYARLKEEGILSSIRGSRTMLAGRKASRQLKVRGYVGMPILLSRFLTAEEHRLFFLQTRAELHARGFATYTLYFEKRQLTPGFLSSCLKQEKVDAVLWLLPGGFAGETALRLRDMGIRFACVSTAGLHEARCRYHVRRAPAIATILRTWRAARIGQASILQLAQESADDLKRLKRLAALAQAEHLDCDFVVAEDGSTDELVAALRRKKKSGVILPGAAASMLSLRAPDALAKVLHAYRVVLIDGPLNFPFSEVPHVPVDLVTVDWRLAAKRIGDDFVTGEATENADAIFFEAEPHLQVPLARYARGF